MLKTEVLVRNVTNLHDARYCAGMGVSYISMPLELQGEKTLSAAQINEIGEWLSGIKILGEIKHRLPENLQEYVLSGFEVDDSQMLQQLTNFEKPIILTIHIDNNDIESPAFKGTLDSLQEKVAFFNIICQGSPEIYKKELLKELNADHKIFWGFDFEVSSISNFIGEINPLGIVLHGSKEIKTGLNEFDYLADILEELDTDDYI